MSHNKLPEKGDFEGQIQRHQRHINAGEFHIKTGRVRAEVSLRPYRNDSVWVVAEEVVILRIKRRSAHEFARIIVRHQSIMREVPEDLLQPFIAPA
eukprot:CAMPEP_0185282480 /NCGR_PEP_ID=MMETSP1359-20130426/67300_1 /TAXON_ID=552665 /ORGANISM="Bigelowiella longifila, Strain CCMP242" /LENGTH=95 /DNA_ID=CAMNT_0027878035 /DNA_START=880 /DNA_END=1167 /DNA_ORIENTATION=+